MMSGIHSVRGVCFVVLSGVLVFAVFPIRAAERIWEGGAGEWSEPSNWSGNMVPQAGDSVTIGAGADVLLRETTLHLGSLTLGGTLVFTNWTTALLATNVTIADGGTMTLPDAFANNAVSNRVHVVCTEFVLEKGGEIDVDAKGYGGGDRAGQGEGGGVFADNRGSGAGYGGAGGWAGYQGFSSAGGKVYGVPEAPLAPGSGGASAHAASSYVGAPGGGAVLIVATNITLNGVITANGLHQNNLSAGAGSGGGIWIRCRRLAATNGLLRANGGDGSPSVGGAHGGGGGGGGRIALHYEELDGQPSLRVEVNAGATLSPRSSTDWSFLRPAMGTIHLSDPNLLSAATLCRFSGRLHIPGFDAWELDTLTVTNAIVGFKPDFELTITGDLTVGEGGALALSGETAFAVGGNLALENGGQLVNDGSRNVDVSGNATLIDGGKWHVFGAPTNAVNPEHTRVHVQGDVSVGAGSWIHPHSDPTNGGSVRFSLRDLTIAAGGGIDADWRGYRGGGFGGASDGQGPGRGSRHNWRGSGGGFGGQGGWSIRRDIPQWGVAGGGLYGSTLNAAFPGSGGGCQRAFQQAGNGGGLIWIEASGNVALEGALRADGLLAMDGAGSAGAGSGGGIMVFCNRFTGGEDALLSAKGGNGQTSGAGPGGGGRIAIAMGGWPQIARDRLMADVPIGSLEIEESHPKFLGTVTPKPGSNGPPEYDNEGEEWRAPQPGTAIFLTLRRGTLITLR